MLYVMTENNFRNNNRKVTPEEILTYKNAHLLWIGKKVHFQNSPESS